MDGRWMAIAGWLGAAGVALGAFGAHGLRDWLETLPDGGARLSWWQTGASYHLWHALALGLGAVVRAVRPGRAARLAAPAFAAGVLLFSGSLYAMALTGVRGLGAVTPLGGVAFLVGWVALALAAGRGASA